MPLATFEDIRILPHTTDIESREECNTTTTLGDYVLDVPLIVASMHSLVTPQMFSFVEGAGSIIVQPRNMAYLNSLYLALSTGFDQALERADLLPENGVLAVEVANGYQVRMIAVLEKIRQHRPDIYVMAGTVCTKSGFDMLAPHADAVLCGIGVGNACTTTVNTGVGLPAAEMLLQLRDGFDYYPRTKIVLCGGVRTYGDFVKAIALGADIVMSGYLFKDCVDTGERYYGEASRQQKTEQAYIEGQELVVNKTQKTSYVVLREAKQALQSAMSYAGARSLTDFYAMAHIVT